MSEYISLHENTDWNFSETPKLIFHVNISKFTEHLSLLRKSQKTLKNKSKQKFAIKQCVHKIQTGNSKRNHSSGELRKKHLIGIALDFECF